MREMVDLAAPKHLAVALLLLAAPHEQREWVDPLRLNRYQRPVARRRERL